MNAKKIICLVLVFLMALPCAFCAPSPLEGFVNDYNENAGKLNAPLLSMDMLIEQDDGGLYEFMPAEETYLVVYMDSRMEPQGVFVEGRMEDEALKNMFLAALAASDDAITSENAADVWNSSIQYEPEADGDYAYFTYGKWIMIFSRYEDAGAYEIYAALTEEAYLQMFGEIFSEESGQEETVPPDHNEKPGQDGEDELPRMPAPQPTPAPEKKIHKL